MRTYDWICRCIIHVNFHLKLWMSKVMNYNTFWGCWVLSCIFQPTTHYISVQSYKLQMSNVKCHSLKDFKAWQICGSLQYDTTVMCINSHLCIQRKCSCIHMLTIVIFDSYESHHDVMIMHAFSEGVSHRVWIVEKYMYVVIFEWYFSAKH